MDTKELEGKSYSEIMLTLGDYTSFINDEVLSTWIEQTKFVGLDPRELLIEIIKRSREQKRGLEEMKSDVAKLITILLTRTNIVGKALKKMDKTAQEDLKRLCTIYQIDYTRDTAFKKKRTTPLGPKELTLSRLTVVFPQVTASILYSAGNVTPAYSFGKFPPFLCFPAGASLIPHDWENMKKGHWRAMKNMRKFYGIKKTGEERNYWKAAHESNLLEGKQRAAILASFKIYADNQVFSEVPASKGKASVDDDFLSDSEYEPSDDEKEDPKKASSDTKGKGKKK